MRHKAKLFQASAAIGMALVLVCISAAQSRVSLGQAIAQRHAVAAAKVQPLQGEVLAVNTVEEALQSLATQAAVIFTGSVAEVKELPGGAARVDFAVEDGLRGATSGGRYSMRVSAWAGGLERYRVGERALFLLHAPSVQGFSSPVGGELGIVPLSGDALVGSVDLRWIATVVQRGAAATGETNGMGMAAATVTAVTASTAATASFRNEPKAAMADSSSRLSRVRGATAQEQLASSNVTGSDVHAIDRDLVTGMLRTWAVAGSKEVR